MEDAVERLEVAFFEMVPETAASGVGLNGTRDPKADDPPPPPPPAAGAEDGRTSFRFTFLNVADEEAFALAALFLGANASASQASSPPPTRPPPTLMGSDVGIPHAADPALATTADSAHILSVALDLRPRAVTSAVHAEAAASAASAAILAKLPTALLFLTVGYAGRELREHYQRMSG